MHDRFDRPVTDRITVAGITAIGHHGVFDHERRDGQTFVADVTVHVDTRAAAAEDRLDLTTDYGLLAEQVAAVLSGEPADLVETVAERIAAVALGHPGVLAVDVVVHKPQAPVTVPFADVTVEIHRDREHRPSVAGPPVTVAAPSPDLLAPDLPSPGWPAPGTLAPAPTDPSGPGAALAAPALGEATVALAAPGRPQRPEEVGQAEPPELQTMAWAPDFAVPPQDRLDVRPTEPVDVVLALGSNLGASHDTLRRAVLDLAEVEGLELTAVAPLARTEAVGGPEQPDFLNTVVLGRTVLSARALLHACQQVESAHGRVREEHWGPRTVDIDIVTYGTTVAVADDLELPHPRAHQRAFVLEPWAQVAPDAVLPGLGGGPVAALAQTAPDRGGIRWMALDWWAAPEAGS